MIGGGDRFEIAGIPDAVRGIGTGVKRPGASGVRQMPVSRVMPETSPARRLAGSSISFGTMPRSAMKVWPARRHKRRQHVINGIAIRIGGENIGLLGVEKIASHGM